MSENLQQNPDGSWSPAQPLGWQGEGIDWEIYERGMNGWGAEGYDKAKWLVSITAGTKLGLRLRMRLYELLHRKKRNSVF